MLREFLKIVMGPLARYCERHLVMWLDMGGEAPDYTPVANASKEAAEIGAQLGREQLNEARYQYDNNMAIARPVVEQQLEISRQTADQGKDYYEYGKSFRPLEQTMLRQAQGQLTPAQIVRLGVSGLNLPSMAGRVGSANVIAGAAQRQPTQAPAPQQQVGQAPIMRFASAGQGAAMPPSRFPRGGVLSSLSSSDMSRMLQQQGADPVPAMAPAAPRPTLPPMSARPPVSAPAPAPAIDQAALVSQVIQQLNQQQQQQSTPWFSEGN